MNFIKKNWRKLILLSYVFLVPVISFAQLQGDAPADTKGKIVDPLGGKFPTIPIFIQTLLEGFLKIGIPIVALAIIYSGFLFVSARGNTEKLGKAKDSLMYTIIGAAILLGAWSIAKLISTTVAGLG